MGRAVWKRRNLRGKAKKVAGLPASPTRNDIRLDRLDAMDLDLPQLGLDKESAEGNADPADLSDPIRIDLSEEDFDAPSDSLAIDLRFTPRDGSVAPLESDLDDLPSPKGGDLRPTVEEQLARVDLDLDMDWDLDPAESTKDPTQTS